MIAVPLGADPGGAMFPDHITTMIDDRAGTAPTIAHRETCGRRPWTKPPIGLRLSGRKTALY